MVEASTTICARVHFWQMIMQVHSGSALQVKQEQAALVNAANENLEHGGGIAGMIKDRGGYIIQQQSYQYIKRNGRLKTSQAISTTAGKLNFIKVIHVVGPRVNSNPYREPQVRFHQKDQLVTAIFNSMAQAEKIQAKAVVIPLVSSGVFGFPIGPAAKCHIDAFKIYAQRPQGENLKKVIFCLFRPDQLQEILKQVLQGAGHFWQWTRYYGTPRQQANAPGKAFCLVCNTIRQQDQVAISTTCCSQICNFCIFQKQLQFCLQCSIPFLPQDFNYTLCQICKQLWIPGHTCRKICQNCSNSQKNRCICGEVLV